MLHVDAAKGSENLAVVDGKICFGEACLSPKQKRLSEDDNDYSGSGADRNDKPMLVALSFCRQCLPWRHSLAAPSM